MQPKVSMVIPCYNEAPVISIMFNSIIAQRWDNIELIIVNDGSTDNTGEIIKGFLPKFRERGFECVVIDQENKDVAAATYEGLKRVTGEFACQVDADDELEPEFVSTMAGWMTEHPEYDWTQCERLFITKRDKTILGPVQRTAQLEHKAERFILRRNLNGAHRTMFRVSYMRACGMLENFYIRRKVHQEPQILLPLAAGGGKLKRFPEPLYKILHVNDAVTHRSVFSDYDSIVKYYETCFIALKETVQHLHLDDTAKHRLMCIADLAFIRNILSYGNRSTVLDSTKEKEEKSEIWLNKYIDLINKYFSPCPKLQRSDISSFIYVITAVEDNILGIESKEITIPSGRMIAWGAMGFRGKELLRTLKGTAYEPTELWDIAGDGVIVKKPDVGSLTDNDMVWILPLNNATSIYEEIKETGCSVMWYEDLVWCVASLEFPLFYNGSLKFSPK